MSVFIPLVITSCKVCPYCVTTKKILKSEHHCFHPPINGYGCAMNISNLDDVEHFCPLAINKEMNDAVLMLEDDCGHWSFAREKNI